MNKKNYFLLSFLLLCIYVTSHAQQQMHAVDLSSQQNFRAINRDINFTSDQGKIVIHLNNKPGDGAAWINNLQFTKGIIEFDVKGKNAMQQSFVGIAFHGINDSTFDAIYFRPFNFQASDNTRKNHSVQYISMPEYDWSALRENFTGKYENKLTGNIMPDDWFHVKIIVGKQVTVYVNDDKEPSLMVTPLNNRTSGSIGFWTGNDSDGDFANLTIKEN